MRFKFLAAAWLVIPTVALANSTNFDWSLSGDFVSGSGTLTANESGVVQSISGSVSDSQLRNIIALLTPHQTYASIGDIGGDNLIFPAPSSPFLDGQGLVFSVGGVGSDPCPFATGCYMNIYYDAHLSQYEVNLSNSGVNGADFVLTAETAPSVPEPSAWAMMILGFAGIGFMIRRRDPYTRGLRSADLN
ncbi:MAG TPA: PEPxxWA-CTERM sorting domain-containing protein [Sphingomicrobium sp.]|nr:PEPxxWA-CTERM sorting domain-containing protein [Sphingomicrobium sp.]